MTSSHPLSALMDDWFPQCDFGVMHHGFVAHGRDYELVVQDVTSRRPGTHRLTFTHVVQADCRSAVRPDVWSASWDDAFLDWNRSKDMDGYIWGTNWSLAYPGLTALPPDGQTIDWTHAIGRTMHAAMIETDRFSLKLIFHGVECSELNGDVSVVSQVVHMLGQPEGSDS